MYQVYRKFDRNVFGQECQVLIFEAFAFEIIDAIFIIHGMTKAEKR